MDHNEIFAQDAGGKMAPRSEDSERDIQRVDDENLSVNVKSVEESPAPTPRYDGWTPELRVKFLDALAECGSVSAAALYVQRSRSSAYALKRRDADFSRTWDAALLLSRDSAVDMLQDRAMNGITEEIYHHGEVVGTRQRYDNRLLLAHIARLDKLAERASVSRGAARFDQMIDAIAAGEDTAAFISEPTEDELIDIISEIEAKSAVAEVEQSCERQRKIAARKAIETQEAEEKAAKEAAQEAHYEKIYGPTYEIDWGDGNELDYGRMPESKAEKLCADHPRIKMRRISHDDPAFIAAMGWE